MKLKVMIMKVMKLKVMIMTCELVDQDITEALVFVKAWLSLLMQQIVIEGEECFEN